MARAFGTFLGVKQSSHLSVGYRLAFLVTGHVLFQIALLHRPCFIIVVRVGSGKREEQPPGSFFPSSFLSKIPNSLDSLKKKIEKCYDRGFRVWWRKKNSILRYLLPKFFETRNSIERRTMIPVITLGRYSFRRVSNELEFRLSLPEVSARRFHASCIRGDF